MAFMVIGWRDGLMPVAALNGSPAVAVGVVEVVVAFSFLLLLPWFVRSELDEPFPAAIMIVVNVVVAKEGSHPRPLAVGATTNA